MSALITAHHTLPPIYNNQSKILILGSFPSVISRKENFYYMHPRNRFWSVIAKLCNEPFPQTVAHRQQLLLKHKIALWDVVQSCQLAGSADQSIQKAQPNDLCVMLESAPIKAIFTNGKKAYSLYHKLIFPKIELHAIALPSTSPANAAYSIERLLEQWSILRPYLEHPALKFK